MLHMKSCSRGRYLAWKISAKLFCVAVISNFKIVISIMANCYIPEPGYPYIRPWINSMSYNWSHWYWLLQGTGEYPAVIRRVSSWLFMLYALKCEDSYPFQNSWEFLIVTWTLHASWGGGGGSGTTVTTCKQQQRRQGRDDGEQRASEGGHGGVSSEGGPSGELLQAATAVSAVQWGWWVPTGNWWPPVD